MPMWWIIVSFANRDGPGCLLEGALGARINASRRDIKIELLSLSHAKSRLNYYLYVPSSPKKDFSTGKFIFSSIMFTMFAKHR